MMAGKLLLSAAIAALASASSALPDPASAKSVASPDGRVTCEFALEDATGRPGAAMAVLKGSFAEQISCCMKQDS